MQLWPLPDFVKKLCLLHRVDDSYKATSKLKKHVFDMCVMNAICIEQADIKSLKHFLDANEN